MADITMCTATKCEIKDKCYRYTAPRSDWQAMMNPPLKVDGKCPLFWDNDYKEKK